MHRFKARVSEGRITLNEPTDQADGDVDLVPVDGGDFGDPLHEELEQALDERIASAREGRLEEADVVIARLQARGARAGVEESSLSRENERVNLTGFDRWVAENNIPRRFEYARGWWDYIELVRRFAAKFEVDDVRVVGHYVVHTPPPEEELPMPAVMLARECAMVAIKWDFGALCRWPKEWTVSVRRRSPYLGPTFGLFDPSQDLRGYRVPGLEPDFVFPAYRQSAAEFSCEVDDEWDVATLLRFVFHEP